MVLKRIVVAPHAGAWIETLALPRTEVESQVAPHAGAWIETAKPALYEASEYVAPHAGAWIETRIILRWMRPLMSHPMRVRGLKHNKGSI